MKKLWKGTLIFVSLLVIAGIAMFCYHKFSQNKDETISKPAASFQMPEKPINEAKVAVVTYEKLYNSHPKMQEMIELARQVDAMKAYWQEKNQIPYDNNPSTIMQAKLGKQIQELEASVQDQYKANSQRMFEGLKGEFQKVEQAIWEEVKAKIELKKEELAKQMDQEAETQKAKMQDNLEKFKTQLDNEYSNQRLNLKLKIQMLQLSEAEENKYRTDLAKIDDDYETRYNKRMESLQKDYTKSLSDYQDGLNKQFQNYQDSLRAEAESRIKKERETRENDLQATLKTKETEMQQEIQKRKQELLGKADKELSETQKQTGQSLSNENKKLIQEIETKQKKIQSLSEEINREIKKAVSAYAQREGYDLVLADYQVNINATDITSDIMQMLKK